MKTLALSACLAAVASTPAADLKDPAQVAAEWKQAIVEAREPVIAAERLGLSASSAGTMIFKSNASTPDPVHWPRVKNDTMPVPPGWQMDPKILHGTTDATPPPGAKLWYYRGQEFWIIPIAATGRKQDVAPASSR